MKRLFVLMMLSALVSGGPAPVARAAPPDGRLLPPWFTRQSFSLEAPPPPPEAREPSDVYLREEDVGRHIELEEGDVLVVSLEANPSTGYLLSLIHI